MNVTEANRINILLAWLLELDDGLGESITHEEGRDAACKLADAANRALSAGLTGDQVRALWHWADSGCGCHDCTDLEPPTRTVRTIQVTGGRL